MSPPSIPVIIIIILSVAVVVSYLCLSGSGVDKPLDPAILTEAIRQVENWDGHSFGSDGERGPWQFTRATWEKMTDKPWAWASSHELVCREEQHRVAERLVNRIILQISSTTLISDAYTVGLIYTAGLHQVLHGNPSKRKREYAERVANVYSELTKPKSWKQTP